MRVALAHHVWATLALMDELAKLPPEQLETFVPGTYGPVIETLRHLVEADSNYLAVVSKHGHDPVDCTDWSLDQLRDQFARQGQGWEQLMASELDPDKVLVRRRADGSETHAPAGLRLAQVVHHSSDHRSQVATALTSLGVEPPDIDVWVFGRAHGLITEVPPQG